MKNKNRHAWIFLVALSEAPPARTSGPYAEQKEKSRRCSASTGESRGEVAEELYLHLALIVQSGPRTGLTCSIGI